jgi:DedD protein
MVMAKTVSEEQLQLRKRARRRLIGAMALVTIVAVFLPMVLDHEPKLVNQDINIQIPSLDAGTFTSKIVPVIPGAPDAMSAATVAPEVPAKAETPARTEPAPMSAAAPVTMAPPQQAAPERPQAKIAPAPPAERAPAPKTAEKSAVEVKAGFVVQVAALNDADKARQMQQQIAAAGVKAYTEVVPTVKGNVTRVRAGPFASRDEAEKMRDKLKDMGLGGNIVPK